MGKVSLYYVVHTNTLLRVLSTEIKGGGGGGGSPYPSKKCQRKSILPKLRGAFAYEKVNFLQKGLLSREMTWGKLISPFCKHRTFLH